MPFSFAMSSKARVVAEYRLFDAACPDEAPHVLAMLHQIGAAGMDSLAARFIDGFGLSRPYCHFTSGWAVFFEVEGPNRGQCSVTVLHVADLTRTDTETGKREAFSRWSKELGLRP